MSFDQLNNGWVRLDSSVYLLAPFWIHPFPVDEHGDHTSPIANYDDGGIGPVQWVNVTHDAAAVLRCDGSWTRGGDFHLWISPGAGSLPYEVNFDEPIKVDSHDSNGWIARKREATLVAESFLGIDPTVSNIP